MERRPTGERVFSIADVAFGDPNTRGAIFSTGPQGDNVGLEAEPVSLIIDAGVPDENGVASLRLKEDIIVGIKSLLDYMCLKLTAEGSLGTIDCDGGPAYDTTAASSTSHGRIVFDDRTHSRNDFFSSNCSVPNWLATSTCAPGNFSCGDASLIR